MARILVGREWGSDRWPVAAESWHTSEGRADRSPRRMPRSNAPRERKSPGLGRGAGNPLAEELPRGHDRSRDVRLRLPPHALFDWAPGRPAAGCDPSALREGCSASPRSNAAGPFPVIAKRLAAWFPVFCRSTTWGQGTHVSCPSRAVRPLSHAAALAGSGVSGCADQRLRRPALGALPRRHVPGSVVIDDSGPTLRQGTPGSTYLLPVSAPSLDAMSTTAPDEFRGAVTVGRVWLLGAADSRCPRHPYRPSRDRDGLTEHRSARCPPCAGATGDPRDRRGPRGRSARQRCPTGRRDRAGLPR